MKISKYRPRATGLLLFSSLVALAIGNSAGASPTATPLAGADPFAVLAGAGITNTGSTTIHGDIGAFPTATITGTASMNVVGTNHGGDAVTQQAQNDLDIAYNDAAGQGPAASIVGDLGGQVLPPGVYKSASSIGITGVLTLDGQGARNPSFVFQAGSTLTTATVSRIELINGASSCNVFWQVGSSATLGTGSSFAGSILAMSDITVTTGVVVDGRVLAREGAVTLDTNTITRPSCVPSAVSTRAFSAQRGKNGVTIRWRTASELDIAGFNVYGQDGAKRIRINPALIAGKVTGTTAGRTYLLVDRVGRQAKASRYWLQVVHVNGSKSWSGSTQARVSG